MLPLLLSLATSVAWAQDEGFVSMFNGKDLLGWHASENPQSCRVEDGCIVVHGPRSHLFYVGPYGSAEFTNFHFKAKVKTMPKANSGIYFHTHFQNEGWPETGYEAQVNNTQQDPRKTGSLYRIEDNMEAPVKDEEWFDYDVIVQGKRIILKINGKTIVDYTEPEGLDRPDRQLASGTIALQAHDPGSKVYYKDLMIKVLPEESE